MTMEIRVSYRGKRAFEWQKWDAVVFSAGGRQESSYFYGPTKDAVHALAEAWIADAPRREREEAAAAPLRVKAIEQAAAAAERDYQKMLNAHFAGKQAAAMRADPNQSW